MLFSTATGYALQTLAALPEDGGYYLARSMAKQLQLPGPYLAKILQNLVQAGILESVRGPKGGFRLAKPAQDVTVGEVVDALEGSSALHGCVMGFSNCGPDNPCPLHHAWSQVKSQMGASMTEVSIQDLRRLNKRSKPLAQRGESGA
jgi:Rrf2 family transcriptional regulator, iron-sulfur cluster assembly transcription factor